jgi:MFS family permease
VAALLLFGMYALYATRVLPGRSAGSRTGTRALELMYTAAFFATAVVVVLSLVDIYADGIKGKTRSLTDSLSQRLNAPLELGLDLSDFDGIEATLADYRRLNPDLSFVAVEVNGRIVIHTDPAQVGATWKPQSGQYEYQVALAEKQASAAPNSAQTETTSVHLGIPQSVIYEQLFRSVKNFVVVFVGAGLLAMLSLNFVTSLSGNVHGERRDEAEAEPSGLRLLRPYYFLTVFVEGLSVSFLPQYLKGLNGGEGGSVSLFFTVYFVAFVLALIPAGRFAERGGGKSVLWMGALVVTASSVLMAMVESYTAMYGVRALAGMGQGMLSIGVQSYILQAARSNQRTRGAAIIVFGYNGGMISGAAIGALLVTYMGAQSVFVIGAIVGALLVGYGLRLIPAITERAVETARQQTGFKHTLSKAVKDWNFVKTTLLIGIPAKATVTGITVFALPLVLSRRNFAQEDIGQIIMLYSAGVLISSTYVSRLVDRLGKTGVILFTGAIVSGLAMTCIGLIGWGPVVDLRFGVVACLIAGMSALGLAHGLINAPIMTHISNTQSADVVGSTSVTSVYRFVERIGHMAGPVLVGQLLASSGQDPIVISALGAVLIVFGLAFAIGPVVRGGGPHTAEARS